MDKQHIAIQIPCTKHPTEHIQRVAADVNTSHHLFCFDCILQQQQESSSPLKSFSEFISTAAQFYSQHKETIIPASNIPDEYTNLLSRQKDVIEGLDTHISNEKKKIGSFFDVLISGGVQYLNSQKNNHLDELDKQSANLRYWYTYFTRQIKKTYPTPENIPQLFPSQEDLITKLNGITNTTELTEFVRGINEDMNEYSKNETKERSTIEDIRQRELFELAKQLSSLEHLRPSYDMKDSNPNKPIDKLSIFIDTLLSETLSLGNIISDVLQDSDGIESRIIDSKQYRIIKKWLAPEYQSSKPKLLFRGGRGGMNAGTFS